MNFRKTICFVVIFILCQSVQQVYTKQHEDVNSEKKIEEEGYLDEKIEEILADPESGSKEKLNEGDNADTETPEEIDSPVKINIKNDAGIRISYPTGEIIVPNERKNVHIKTIDVFEEKHQIPKSEDSEYENVDRGKQNYNNRYMQGNAGNSPNYYQNPNQINYRPDYFGYPNNYQPEVWANLNQAGPNNIQQVNNPNFYQNSALSNLNGPNNLPQPNIGQRENYPGFYQNAARPNLNNGQTGNKPGFNQNMNNFNQNLYNNLNKPNPALSNVGWNYANSNYNPNNLQNEFLNDYQNKPAIHDELSNGNKNPNGPENHYENDKPSEILPQLQWNNLFHGYSLENSPIAFEKNNKKYVSQKFDQKFAWNNDVSKETDDDYYDTFLNTNKHNANDLLDARALDIEKISLGQLIWTVLVSVLKIMLNILQSEYLSIFTNGASLVKAFVQYFFGKSV